jgi:ketosteroid isomerase-like protein
MRIHLAQAAVVALLLSIATPLHAQYPGQLLKLDADWEAAFNAGDWDAVAALYTEDAVRYPPDMPPIEGRAAIRADLAQSAGLQISVSVLGGMLGDEVGVNWGTYEITGSYEGQAVLERGRYMSAIKKMPDGSVKVYRDMWHKAE